MRQSSGTSRPSRSARWMRQGQLHARLQSGGDAERCRALAAVELEGLAVGAVLELQRQHAHADEVGAVDALEALDDHGADAEQSRALGRPVARRAGAVFLAGEDHQRHAVASGSRIAAS